MSNGSSATIYENHRPELPVDPPSLVSARYPKDVQEMRPLSRRSTDRQMLLRLGMERRQLRWSSRQRAKLGCSGLDVFLWASRRTKGLDQTLAQPLHLNGSPGRTRTSDQAVNSRSLRRNGAGSTPISPRNYDTRCRLEMAMLRPGRVERALSALLAATTEHS